MSEFVEKAVGGITLLLIVLCVEKFRLRHFWNRRCTGALWRRSFPDATKKDIRDFLGLMTSAFAFADSRRLRFAPSDRILSVYKALYPFPKLSGDAMELETFVEGVRERFGVDLVPAWREDITLGELFSQLQDSEVVSNRKG